MTKKQAQLYGMQTQGALSGDVLVVQEKKIGVNISFLPKVGCGGFTFGSGDIMPFFVSVVRTALLFWKQYSPCRKTNSTKKVGEKFVWHYRLAGAAP